MIKFYFDYEKNQGEYSGAVFKVDNMKEAYIKMLTRLRLLDDILETQLKDKDTRDWNEDKKINWIKTHISESILSDFLKNRNKNIYPRIIMLRDADGKEYLSNREFEKWD